MLLVEDDPIGVDRHHHRQLDVMSEGSVDLAGEFCNDGTQQQPLLEGGDPPVGSILPVDVETLVTVDGDVSSAFDSPAAGDRGGAAPHLPASAVPCPGRPHEDLDLRSLVHHQSVADLRQHRRNRTDLALLTSFVAGAAHALVDGLEHGLIKAEALPGDWLTITQERLVKDVNVDEDLGMRGRHGGLLKPEDLRGGEEGPAGHPDGPGLRFEGVGGRESDVAVDDHKSAVSLPVADDQLLGLAEGAQSRCGGFGHPVGDALYSSARRFEVGDTRGVPALNDRALGSPWIWQGVEALRRVAEEHQPGRTAAGRRPGQLVEGGRSRPVPLAVSDRRNPVGDADGGEFIMRCALGHRHHPGANGGNDFDGELREKAALPGPVATGALAGVDAAVGVDGVTTPRQQLALGSGVALGMHEMVDDPLGGPNG